MKFKNNDYVRITTGKFRGWRGRIGFKPERENNITYYTLFVDEKKTRQGTLNHDTIGLGLIINIPENHLKEVVRF